MPVIRKGPMNFSNFYKYHALGNDYLVLSAEDASIPLTREVIQLICDRHYGLGSDGILYGDLSTKPPKLRIFNPDGSEAEKSGNGLRIFARYLYDNNHVNKNPFEIHTIAGNVNCRIEDPNNRIQVDMGTATFDQEGVFMIHNKIYPFHILSIGNPHCVIFLENEATKTLVQEIGPIVENDSRFPNRTNVQLLEIIDRSNIKIEIWERGAGYTLASGSGACAAASVAFKLGKIEQQVTVHMPGGPLSITINPNFNISMMGPTTFVGKFSLNLELISKKSLHHEY